MDEQELRKLIEKLQAEIKATQIVNKKDQELLFQLESDINEFLRRADENGGKYHPTTVMRLQDGLSHFETSHPLLTTLVNQILDVLSNAGV
jgi:hypothetical protein